ncbi:MAG: sigma-70 family RNA polymerase sigma factor [Phycisphaerae bacterium]|nr:sigma-70 family RNA polymerase sigma factor [Phycisphaerae bacterium]
MRSTLINSNSPFARQQSRRTVAMDRSTARLSEEDRDTLKNILLTPEDFVDDPSFHKANAYKKLFEQAPEIPKPNTSWYHPVMEDLNSDRNMKTVVNVVLNAKQEQALFLQFNYARYRVSRLQKQVGDKPVTDEQAADLLKWHGLAHRLRDQIAQSNLALVLAMAKRVRHSEMDFADLISEGNMALLRATDKFNVSRGFKFSTYACRAILKAFSRSGMKHSQYRQLFPTDFDPALERSDFSRRKFDSHELDCAEEVLEIVAANRADLTDVEQQVISHRFALNRGEEEQSVPLTLEQVGQIVGLTKERVRQIQNKALQKIRKTLEESYIDGPEEPEAAPAGGEEDD